ncbi:DUF1028 domain-containing protein [Nocardia carnea]|uniref:DUF1028 domain-containing protein n=1 Tax=Nocardia carnea TaxID=37328 RepID=A0ABW7TK71_9NOCA|nr:DUF1028 domain-containing protein [Nocardia carnea]
MTFSIVAGDPETGAWGVGVASKYLAVGSMVPAAQADAGALATQAYTNASFRPLGLSSLRGGRSAGETLDVLLSQDSGRAARQVGIVDNRGGSALWTGGDCSPYAGGIRGEGYVVMGNLLAGPEVITAMSDAWTDGDPEKPLAQRLCESLQAGEAAGGDRRGRQSAAILVARRGSDYILGTDIEIDLRVDDHDFPLTELGRLLELRYGAPP